MRRCTVGPRPTSFGRSLAGCQARWAANNDRRRFLSPHNGTCHLFKPKLSIWHTARVQRDGVCLATQRTEKSERNLDVLRSKTASEFQLSLHSCSGCSCVFFSLPPPCRSSSFARTSDGGVFLSRATHGGADLLWMKRKGSGKESFPVASEWGAES